MALPLAPVLLLLLLLPLMPPLMLPLPMPLPCLLLALPLLLPRLPLQPTLLPSLLLLLLPLLLLLLTPLLLQQLPPVYIHRCALPGAVLPRPLRRVERTHMCIRPSTLYESHRSLWAPHDGLRTYTYITICIHICETHRSLWAPNDDVLRPPPYLDMHGHTRSNV